MTEEYRATVQKNPPADLRGQAHRVRPRNGGLFLFYDGNPAEGAFMEIRFQADEDLNETVIAALKRHEPRIDFLTAFNAGIKGMPDVQVLGVAARLGRLLVTHDLKTCPMHLESSFKRMRAPVF